jgi:DNA-binding transcriptional ArsR family regulator
LAASIYGMSTNKSTSPEKELIKVTKALSNLTRVKMLHYLNQNKFAMVSSFTRMLKIPAPTASKNLKVLRTCGLVHREKVGKRIIHSLNQDLWKVVQELITNLS